MKKMIDWKKRSQGKLTLIKETDSITSKPKQVTMSRTFNPYNIETVSSREQVFE